MKKILLKIFLGLLITIGFSKAQQLDYVGYISCLSKDGTVKSKYAILETTKILGISSSLNTIIRQLEKKYLITQIVKGKCSITDSLEIYLTKPIMALELLDALIRIYNFQYYIEGNVSYKPVYLLMYQTSISFQRLFSLIKEKIKSTNKNLIVEWVPESKTIVIADTNSNVFATTKKVERKGKGCYQEELIDYVDLCKGKECTRFSLSIEGTKVNLKPYYVCKDGKRIPFKVSNSCKEETDIKTLYLDKTNLTDLLKVFEKLFKIQFIYDLADISQLKNTQNLHLVFECLTKEKAIEFLKKNFHLYLEQKTPDVYRIFADRDNYSLALRKVSNLVTKVFYIQNISLRDFIKLLEIYYRDKVVYSADPEFNAVTVIATKEAINSIIKKFGIYIRNSEISDRLMSKIYYVKYGELEDLVTKIKQFLSKKGIVKTLEEARAIEITDYPTNLAMIEKVFGKFLSQKPIKIKVIVKFINIEKNFARSLGINWDATYTGTSKVESVGSINIAQNAGSFSVSASFLYRKLNPLNISISAAETIGLAKTLSSPSLILLNGQEGTISQGVQIPYQAVDENGNPTTNLVQATLTLNVKPLLLPDGRILLKLNLSNNSPNTSLSVNGQPAINTFTIQQDFIVPNGGTIVIGGVLQKKIDNGENGVPILRKIPLLGWLFKTKNWSKQDSELYVIVTAKVISD
ncbi:MAG: hypothetical protein DSZ30_00730 [Aquificaceae bacterium]|nr:MAG: hypothetical protein DSZ30_00730 [Aquificaceae bacterium]